eukprot:CAMPEP_0178917484 /NCGR_PEP_ID=MMETSP0786-20121207/13273_1 /TAXON_ID=186022 /ORGANISM="Thalassionema frauenfeldii, Strain CCMP 1798" /LENGTH=340 /DNA_ID=CAMNT_0020591041 /DNA_START=110 /DNA_END=1132 /DNA_ORIENTATION=+
MKLTVLALSAFTASAFTTAPPPSFQTATSSVSTTSLFGSARALKKKSRAAWLELKYGSVDVASEASSAILTNDDGLEYVQLTSENGSTSKIYLYGGVVTSYKDADGTEFIAVRPDAKMDGSKPISGGLSHCWPQFGPGEIQQHGFARNVNWSIVEQSSDKVVLELVPSDYTKEMWDKEFRCEFTVSINDEQLDTNMAVTNTGDEDSFDFQAALHSYFTVSSLDQLEIAGSFEGKEFLNKMVGDEGEMQTEDRSVITIGEEYDRVYKGVNDPVLKDAGTGKSLSVLNTEGWEDTVLWNPYGNEGMGYNNFVCVESVKFDPVTLEGGASWTGTMALKPSKDE